jgi:hypothetical protein
VERRPCPELAEWALLPVIVDFEILDFSGVSSIEAKYQYQIAAASGRGSPALAKG